MEWKYRTEKAVRMRWPKRTVKQRFMEKVVKTNYCWIWTGAVHGKKGYGSFWLGERKYTKSHRAAWILYRGPIANGGHVLHHCDNPSCVNPKHLYVGTNSDNTRDRVERGRCGGALGEANSRAKLKETDVIAIRKSKLTNRELSTRYGIHHKVVHRIRTRQSWRHVK